MVQGAQSQGLFPRNAKAGRTMTSGFDNSDFLNLELQAYLKAEEAEKGTLFRLRLPHAALGA